MKVPSHLTIRNLPSDLSVALRREKRRRGVSLNQTVIDLLKRSLGVERGSPSNALARLAGGWTAAEHREFEAAVAVTGGLDDRHCR